MKNFDGPWCAPLSIRTSFTQGAPFAVWDADPESLVYEAARLHDLDVLVSITGALVGSA